MLYFMQYIMLVYSPDLCRLPALGAVMVCGRAHVVLFFYHEPAGDGEGLWPGWMGNIAWCNIIVLVTDGHYTLV